MDVNTEQPPDAVPSHSRDDDAAFLNAALHWIEMRLRKLAHAAGHGKWEARHDSELHSTHAALKAALAAHALKMPQLAPALRVLVCGRAQTPSIDAVLALFTRQQVLERLSRV